MRCLKVSQRVQHHSSCRGYGCARRSCTRAKLGAFRTAAVRGHVAPGKAFDGRPTEGSSWAKVSTHCGGSHRYPAIRFGGGRAFYKLLEVQRQDTPESLPPGAWRPPANFQIQGLHKSKKLQDPLEAQRDKQIYMKIQ